MSRRLLALALEEADPEPAGPPPLGPGEASWERLALAALLARVVRLERAVAGLARAADSPDAAGPSGGWMSGESRSLSGGGASVQLPRPLESGTPVEIELLLPDEPPATIRAVGRVTTCSGGTPRWPRPLVGLAFTAICPSDLEALVRFTFRVERARLRQRRQGNNL